MIGARSIRWIGAAGVAVSSMAGCERSHDHASSGAPRGEPTGVFTVRARVETVPEAGKPGSGFTILHEPIDDFPNPDGTRGMSTMSMPMPLAKGVSVADVRVGDVVEVTFAAWTTPGNLGLEARALRKLPAETALRFGKAAPMLESEK